MGSAVLPPLPPFSFSSVKFQARNKESDPKPGYMDVNPIFISEAYSQESDLKMQSKSSYLQQINASMCASYR